MIRGSPTPGISTPQIAFRYRQRNRINPAPPGQGGELLAEGQVLDRQMASRAHGREERRQKGCDEAGHGAGENPGPLDNRQWAQGGTPPSLT